MLDWNFRMGFFIVLHEVRILRMLRAIVSILVEIEWL